MTLHNNGRKKKNRSILGLTMVLLLLSVTLYYLFRDDSFHEVLNILASARSGFVLCIFAMMFLFIAMEGLGDNTLLKALGSRIWLSTSIQIAFVGYYFSMITPSSTGGQPMQLFYLSRKGEDISKVSLALVCFTLLYQFVLLLYCLFMIVVQHSFLAGAVDSVKITLTYGFTIGSAFILLLLSTMISQKGVTAVTMKIISLLAKFRLIKDEPRVIQNASRQIQEYSTGIKYLVSHPMVLLKIVLIVIVQLSCFFSIPYFALRTLGIKKYSLFQILGIQSLLHVSVCAIPLPGSIGANEAVFYILYGQFITEEFLLPAVILGRGAGFFTFLILSGLITFITHATTKKREKS